MHFDGVSIRRFRNPSPCPGSTKKNACSRPPPGPAASASATDSRLYKTSRRARCSTRGDRQKPLHGRRAPPATLSEIARGGCFPIKSSSSSWWWLGCRRGISGCSRTRREARPRTRRERETEEGRAAAAAATPLLYLLSLLLLPSSSFVF